SIQGILEPDPESQCHWDCDPGRPEKSPRDQSEGGEHDPPQPALYAHDEGQDEQRDDQDECHLTSTFLLHLQSRRAAGFKCWLRGTPSPQSVAKVRLPAE